MSDYTTTAAVKRQLNIGQTEINTVDDDLIDVYVTQASQAIDTFTGRTFSESIGTLYYDARYPVIEGRILYFDQDYLGVDAVSNGVNGTINPANYRLLPQHYAPKYALQLLDQSGLSWQVGNDGGAQNAITVIGTTGYCLASSRPADITLAATKLAAWLYQNRDNDGAIIQMADGTTSIPAEAPAVVLKLLDKYIRRVAYTGGAHG